ncbi:MAG TPA: ATP-binding protein [Gemmataceae bacterium]|nr:ATP-binding protein [Gemmataceae bacterium]
MPGPQETIAECPPAPHEEIAQEPITGPTVEAKLFHQKSTLSRPKHLLELACKVVGASQGGIGLLSGDGELVEHITYGLLDSVAAQLWQSPWSEELTRFVLQQPGPANIEDLGRAYPHLGMAPGLPLIGPFLGIPLTCHGRNRGALYLARPQGAPPFNCQDEETVLPIHAWLEQGSLFEEARLLAQLRMLTQVAQAAAGSLDLAPILAVAMRELDKHLPFHVSAVWLLEQPPSTHKGPRRSRGMPASRADNSKNSNTPPCLKIADIRTVYDDKAEQLGLKPGLRMEMDKTPFEVCLRNGQALYLDLSRPEERISVLANELANRGANSTCAVPLHSGERTVGILQSVCLRPNGFTNEQVQLLYLIADLLGPAISNCQLFGRLRGAYEELRLTQDQLIQAEKMRALGELAGGMAHDFNNSLCGVLGFLELALADKDLGPAGRGYLESARTCTLDAAQTVRRVQSFARWERNELSVQLLDLNELVRQTIELTRPKWESLTQARGAPISVEVLTESTAWISASAAELREVLTNLVFNAVDAMPNGGKLTVRTWSTERDVFLAVQDTGIGMSEAVRQRLFEPFFTTKGERGNGLGLSVTFGIIQRYQGEIAVDSRVGKGSTFTVRLPLLSAHEPVSVAKTSKGAIARPDPRAAPVKPQPSVPAPKAVPSASRSLRILVVEDEEPIRRFLATSLTHLGHRPRLTADANEGIQALAEESFDVVLTDLGLPGLNGEEVARTVARQSPQTPVILLTGWSNQLKEEALPLEGVTCVIGKPVTLSTLAKTLNSVCPA